MQHRANRDSGASVAISECLGTFPPFCRFVQDLQRLKRERHAVLAAGLHALGGVVQTAPARSISDQRALRTSPEPEAVRTRKSKASTVSG